MNKVTFYVTATILSFDPHIQIRHVLFEDGKENRKEKLTFLTHVFTRAMRKTKVPNI